MRNKQKSWVWVEHKFWEIVAIEQEWREGVDRGPC